ncbi:MAG TPA: hypothetical protein VI356_01105 [Myxococcales bacterium]
MRWTTLLLVALAWSCDPQADPAYPGEPLLTLQGQVVSQGPLPELEAAMLWQRGDPPATTDQDLATRAPVQAGFPALFTAHLYHPPPAAARRSLAPGEPIYARATAAAVPKGIAAAQISGGAAAPPGPPGAGGGFGVDARHWVIYLASDVPAGSLTAWWLGAPLAAGFHLLVVTPVNPACMTAAQLDACAADLAARGVRDDGTSAPGTARAFCVAPYRLSLAPPSESLVLDLGAVGLGPPGGGCP